MKSTLPMVRRRRVIRLGKSLYSVIPHEFAQKHSLRQGDLISIIVNQELIKVVPFGSKGGGGNSMAGMNEKINS